MTGVAIYQEQAITTQSPGNLVLLLYDGAIKFLKMARQDMENGDILSRSQHITRGVDIIEELLYCLDMEEGDQIAKNLRDLYLFMLRYLNEASTQSDSQKISDVIDLLDGLRSGWRAITG